MGQSGMNTPSTEMQVLRTDIDAEKVDRGARPPRANQIEITAPPYTRDTTYPEKKRPHCAQVRPPRTSHNGLARSTLSFFGRRFRRKYGAILKDLMEE